MCSPCRDLGLEGVGDGRRAGGHRQSRHAPFQGGDAPLKHILGGVGQTAVDVAALRQAEAVRRLPAVGKHIGGGGVDGHGPGVGGGVGLFLPHMELEGFEFIVRHILRSFLFFCFSYRTDNTFARSGSSCAEAGKNSFAWPPPFAYCFGMVLRSYHLLPTKSRGK